MIGFFSDPYSDELLYSACARFSDRSKYRNVATTARQLFGGVTGVANIAFPNRLSRLLSALPQGHGHTVDRIIDDHTLLGFYAPFISQQRLKIIRDQMAGDQENRINSRLAVNTGKIPMPSSLRFCPECVILDRGKYGETYWHRCHQLPGIEVCTAHSTFLESSRAAWRDRKSCTAFMSAESAIDNRPSRRIDCNDRPQFLQLELAKQAQWILNWRGNPPSGPELQARYHNQLLRRGLAYYGGRLKNNEIVRDFISFYSHDLLKYLHSDVQNPERAWLFTLLRRDRIHENHPPLRHLLIMTFLECSPEYLLETFEEYKPFGDGPWPCLNRAASHFGELTAETCRITNGQKHNKGRPVGLFSCHCGFRYLRVGPDRDGTDHYLFNRVVSYGHEWESHFKEQWNNGSVTLTNLANELGVIPFTLRRHAIRLGLAFPRKGRWARPTSQKVLAEYGNPRKTFEAELQTRRQDWLMLRRKKPKASRNQLISLAPYGYYWLTRHDRKWLNENMPAAIVNHARRKPVSWKMWDQRFPKMIAKISGELIAQKGEPVRVSKEEIIRRLGHRAWLEHHLHKLPNTAEALNLFVETRERFLIRRVRWTESLFHQEGRCPTHHQLEVRAGTRTKTGRAPNVQAAIHSALRNLQSVVAA